MQRRHNTQGARIGEVMRAVQADLARPWTVAEMAQVLGVTDAQLRRLCTCAVGASPRQLLCNLRLQAAALLLHNPGLRVKEIQARVGIADSSHFCRDFRDRFGVSPTEYRYQNARRADSIDNIRRSGP
jgi:AraC-like DNA-binding protein